ncbi:hypothetical protein ACIBED_16135 [Rhodococcus coprophilus]|uniref:hypothetical protein n=1 Tax=Rhodococcus coprophilus TaxID=38310 RepID=UPI003791974C
MRWTAALAVPMVVAAGLVATASSAIPSVAEEIPDSTSASLEVPPTLVGVLPADPASPASFRSPAEPSDPVLQHPPAPAGAGATSIFGEGPAAIPELVYYAYRAAEMQMAVDSPECGLPWHLLAAVGRLASEHADGGRTDILGTLTTPKVAPGGALGPMLLPAAAWETHRADGNADGTTDAQNVFDATLAASTWMCADGARLREPDGEARAVALFDASPEYLANVREWSATYAKGAEVAEAAMAPPPARPVPAASDIAAPAPALAVPGSPQADPATPGDTSSGTGEDGAEGGIPALPPVPLPVLPELPAVPCLVPAFCN